MKENIKKSNNNQVHIFGFINDVRMNQTESGKTAINIDVCTTENFKNKDGESQVRRSFHDVALFTDDKELIKSFEKIGADIEANNANRGVEGYKPKSHQVSLDGILVNKTNTLGDSDKTYRTLQIMANEASIDLDTKQAESEKRNRAEIVGNIANISLHEDKKFAVVTLIHHYRPEGSETDYQTTVDVRINGDRSTAKGMYDGLVSGDIKKGDFVRVGGQLHNNRYETTDGTRYGVSLDVTSFSSLKKREAEAEKVEVKEEKAAKKAPAKTAKTAKTAKAGKKATPRKKGMGVA